MEPRFLEIHEIVAIHQDQIARYGGSPGVRDMGLLESAVAMPRSGFRGEHFHSFPFGMAAAYLFHLVKNHPFVDGNKRVGAAAALVFPDLNGADLKLSNRALVDLVLQVAEGRKEKPEVETFLRDRARA
ncbi:MAG: type II toxin-antitoxin system death-on-curing family toxin [Planctomycetes bacterium]|nr:type II toxin-antitoxin system death-on-curing family toxin [Planctomycetota bacterium]